MNLGKDRVKDDGRETGGNLHGNIIVGKKILIGRYRKLRNQKNSKKDNPITTLGQRRDTQGEI